MCSLANVSMCVDMVVCVYVLLCLSAGVGGAGQGLVVDLRGNPGGLLDAAVEIASYLVRDLQGVGFLVLGGGLIGISL